MREKGAGDYICESSLSCIFMSEVYLSHFSMRCIKFCYTTLITSGPYLNYSFSKVKSSLVQLLAFSYLEILNDYLHWPSSKKTIKYKYISTT